MIMEQEEITRRNVAIAEYMGWKLSQGAWFDDSSPSGFPHSTEMLAFNADWGMLMPVVEKITKEKKEGLHLLVSANGYSCRFGMGRNVGWNKGYSMIEATWLAASDYIISKQNKG